MPFYSEAVARDANALDGVPATVAAALRWAPEAQPSSQVIEREMRARLAPTIDDDRGRAVVIHTRLFATRIHDGVMHPFVGLERAASIDLPSDDERQPEAEFIREGDELRQQWLRHRHKRPSIETDIAAMAAQLAWD